jgi:hypothetical protein
MKSFTFQDRQSFPGVAARFIALRSARGAVPMRDSSRGYGQENVREEVA